MFGIVLGRTGGGAQALAGGRRAVNRLLREGDRARDAGDWARAATCYRRALESEPAGAGGPSLLAARRRAEIAVQLGHMRRELNDPSGAEAAYRRSIAEDGTLADGHLWLALLLSQQGRIVEAMASGFRGLRCAPDAAAREEMAELIRRHLRGRDYSPAEIEEALASGHLPESPAVPDDPDSPLRPIPDLPEKVASYFWHHSINLGDGVVTPGIKSRYILRREADAAFGPLVAAGRSLIDIGAWNGYFTVEAKRRGFAPILAVDQYTWAHHELRGRETFDLVMSRLGIEVETRVLDVAEISAEAVGCWDVVLFLGVFYHLLDPIAALQRLAEITGEVLVVETHLALAELSRPAMLFYPADELDGDPTNWWSPNRAAMEALLKTVGFARVVFTPHPVVGGSRGFFHAFKTEAAYEAHRSG